MDATISFAGIAVVVYAAIVVSVAIYFRRFNRNTDEYFRASGSAPWWLVGVSIFMQSFSAVTFTGVAAQAFVAGLSAGWIIWCNAFIFVVHAAVLAPMFRRTRAQTQADVIRERFGERFEQFFVYVSAATTPFFLAINLLGAATFVSAMFGFSLVGVIVAVGSVATISSVVGGRWGCMANGFLQALMLVAVTGVVGVLCLLEVGGARSLFQQAAERGIDGYGAMLRPVDAAPAAPGVLGEGMLTAPWLAALLVHATIMSASLATACRYHAVSDERASRKAALLACALLLGGSVAWGLPPLVSRVLYPDEVRAVTGLRSPEDSAYAIAAKHVLPPSLNGVVVVAMIAATMSVLDGAQAFVAANLANNGLPVLLRRFGREPPRGRLQLLTAQVANLMVGAAVLGIAVTIAIVESAAGMFDLMLELMGSIGVPLHVPMALGLVWRRAPATAAWLALAAGFAASAVLLAASLVGVFEPLWHTKVAIIAAVGAAAFAGSAWRRPTRSGEERSRVQEFFRKLDCPLADDEITTTSAFAPQQRAISSFGLVVAVLLAASSLATAADRQAIVWIVAATVAAVALLVRPRPSSTPVREADTI